MDWQRDAIGLVAGFLIAVVTSPAGVSGAVFLLPVQLTLLDVPNPRLTPTNLLYNVVSGPGALVRYVRAEQVDRPLVTAIVTGSLPGVVLGAVLRVHVASDPTVFRLIAAAVLLPTGLLVLRRRAPRATDRAPSRRTIVVLGFATGIVGGLYGVGGGSLLAPLLAGSGMAMAVVAPAALAGTFVTSIAGVVAFALLATGSSDTIAPDWSLGVAAGVGGLLGGYLGARLQPRVPERRLKDLLGVLAISLSLLYVAQAVLAL